MLRRCGPLPSYCAEMSPLPGWQVTLCDPMWHVSSRSGVATLRTAIYLLLTYCGHLLYIYTNWTCMQQDIHCFMPLNTTVQHLRKFTDTVDIVCDPGFMKRSSVHPSVCPIDPQQQRQPAGLLLSDLPTGYIDRQLRAPSTRRAPCSRRSAATAPSSTALSSKRGQCHVDSRRRRLNTSIYKGGLTTVPTVSWHAVWMHFGVGTGVHLPAVNLCSILC